MHDRCVEVMVPKALNKIVKQWELQVVPFILTVCLTHTRLQNFLRNHFVSRSPFREMTAVILWPRLVDTVGVGTDAFHL